MDEKTIGVGLLSYGMSGEVFHGPLLQAHKHFDIKAVYHRRKNSGKHSFREVYDLNEIFNDKDIELIIVNTPSPLHYDHAKQALLAGKHVVVEKPFTVHATEADELIALAKQKNRILTVFQNRRWDSEFLTLKKIIDERSVGKIVEFEAHYDRYRNQVEHQSWKEIGQEGTGVLYNLGSHMLDQVLVLFGKPKYVDARVGVRRPGGVSDDFYDIRLEYDDFLVVVKSSYLVKSQGPRYILHGTEGSFIKSGLDPQEEDLKNKKTPGGPGWGMEPETLWGTLNTTANGMTYNGPVETIPGNYLVFYDILFNAIRKGTPLPVMPEESGDVIHLIELCYESNRLKKAIRVN
jgi:scyllo-inositol 2-dehydrogenase (NADP+)